MRLSLISPRLALQKGDFLGSGVPYWPLELVTLAAHARNAGDDVQLLDLFGNAPSRLTDMGDHYLQGQPVTDFLDKPEVSTVDAFILYAISYMSHQELLSIVRELRQRFPDTAIGILENSQAVTAYSLQRMAPAFLDEGADLLICGEPYFNWDAIKSCLSQRDQNTVPSNVISRARTGDPQRLFQPGFHYPVPAWDLVKLQNYWALPYSHGPKTPTFLPVLTSRGCPYPCNFCVVPETNDKRWRGNEPERVVEELLSLRDRFGVHDFQVEDLNPTVRHERWEKICELLIEKQANIRFYFVSGTKAETVHLDKIALLAKGGCRYISISPESGSASLMKQIGKRFRYQHGLDLVTLCRQHGIRTQACFLVGHPDEHEEDFVQTRSYLTQMVRAGLDEVAVFVVAPFAGSELHARNAINLDNQSALPSFSPKGREGYETLERHRSELIRTFFIEKLKCGFDLWLQGLRALIGRPQTKMENLPRRVAFILWLVARQQWQKRRGETV